MLGSSGWDCTPSASRSMSTSTSGEADQWQHFCAWVVQRWWWPNWGNSPWAPCPGGPFSPFIPQSLPGGSGRSTTSQSPQGEEPSTQRVQPLPWLLESPWLHCNGFPDGEPPKRRRVSLELREIPGTCHSCVVPENSCWKAGHQCYSDHATKAQKLLKGGWMEQSTPPDIEASAKPWLTGSHP